MLFLKKEKLEYGFIGDFNAKTSVLPDYIILDDNIIDILNLDEDNEILEYLFDYQNLLRNNIPLHRVSGCSCKPNNYGHRLLNLCKKLNIYSVNSRVSNDKGVGARTCKDISVVDYLILSSQLFPLLKKIAIAEFERYFLIATVRFVLNFKLHCSHILEAS
ncbi:unnamed protein product [Mytilus coruscus]|uniref:Endonuclease/exonuclease/phosphatase domain-containing protein n=1 Tax=Mytilus coruscus TaxID=42192 RepID=A0A6J8DYS3_MYTCO|nr:unnamed protein product [Mytilus coruscus]